jgi:septal ring factor EnvC (AmiA/AmiB activator)
MPRPRKEAGAGGYRYDRSTRPTLRDLALSLGLVMTALNTFVLISGTFSVLSVIPLMYLAVRSVRDAKDLRRIQYELADLITESKEIGEEVQKLQREIQSDQRDAKTDGEHTLRTVEQVSESVEQVSSAVEQVNEVVTAEAAAPRRGGSR